jgi:uncharacterized protein YjbI with pentapeptide repeats
MSKETKLSLRRRWTDPSFVAALRIPLGTWPTSAQLQHLDLRGVPKLANGEPLWHFQIQKAEAKDIDLSHGDGALIVRDSTVSGLTCMDFRFDRASDFRKSAISASSFRGARLKLNAVDMEFSGCDFGETLLAGGFQEYGFRRCNFTACDFSSAQWRNTYLRACRFTRCNFTGCTIAGSTIAGFKHEKLTGFSIELFENCEIRGLQEEGS